MTQKAHIIDTLGERRLLLPSLLNDALAANDRAKYLFSIVQAAQGHADHPHAQAVELRTERLAAGITDESFDKIPAGSARANGEKYRVPRVQAICSLLYDDVRRMLEPICAADDVQGGSFSERLKVLSAKPWCNADDLISATQISAMTRADRKSGDSLHLLVMDMHKALNTLQARIAQEIVEGALCYEIEDNDRPRIAAFMRGVNQTRPLKFDHPGLGTTATRVGERLVIQNDIGTTDAHVLVVHVDGCRATVTYTDVHMQRLLFFQSLFDGWHVDWEDTRSRSDCATEEGIFHLCVGVFETHGEEDLDRHLAFLGSRLVYLIDWNRARKRLRLLLPKKETLALLKWAADNDYGHMAFLRAGGEHVIFDALGFVAKPGISFGTRLDELLERDAAYGYMKFVIKTCAQAMLEGRPDGLLQDEIRAEMVNYFHSAQQSLLDIASEHAALAIEIASGIRDCLMRGAGNGTVEMMARNAERAKEWEHGADELVNRARGIVRRADRSEFYRTLIESADDIVDELEEAAFHLTLLAPETTSGALQPPLTRLAGLLVGGAQEYVKALETARVIHRGGPREDIQDFLEAIHRIVAAERDSDAAQRGVKSALLGTVSDCRQLYGVAECARNLEAAADALMHTALSLRDHMLGEVITE